MQSDRAHGFREEDIPLLQHLANQIALAVQNDQFYQLDRYRRRLAETFYNLGRALARPMDRQAILDLILQQLVTIIPHDRGAILLQTGEVLEMVAAHGFPPSKRVFQWRIPIKPGDVFDEIRRTQQPLVLADALQRRDWHHIEDVLPARSWMGVPLVHDDRVVGMLSLARETHVPYTEDEVTFAASFAGQAMIALENARLRDQMDDPQTKGIV
jgi:GAF domain-containing protein